MICFSVFGESAKSVCRHVSPVKEPVQHRCRWSRDMFGSKAVPRQQPVDGKRHAV